jgi:hypothetical protein
MKNIHILPTEVFNQMPYQIWRKKDGGLWRPTKEFPINSNLNGKVNIYITSEEEIKEGDYVIEDYGGIVYGPIDRESIVKNPKKIIITTDPDLIADGIQELSEDVIQYLVDNPSCEFVEVKRYYETLQDGLTFDRIDYKIIIPKEQQKQHLIDMMKADEELGLYDEDSPAYNHQARLVHDLGKKIKLEQKSREIKLEDVFNDEKRQGVKDLIDTHKQRLEKYSERFDNDKSEIGNPDTWGKRIVEEAAYQYAEPYRCPATNENEYCKHDIISAFNNGAKWQEERMYSEEEVIAFGEFIFKHTLLAHSKGVKNLFEQFKKK